MFFVFAYIFSQIQKRHVRKPKISIFFTSFPSPQSIVEVATRCLFHIIEYISKNNKKWPAMEKKLKLNSNSQRDLHDHDQGSQDKYFEANSKSQFPYVSTCYIWKRSQVGPKLKRCTFRSSHWTKNDFDGIYHFHENKLFGLTFKSCQNTFTIIWTVLREDSPTRLLRHRTKDNSALKGIWH